MKKNFHTITLLTFEPDPVRSFTTEQVIQDPKLVLTDTMLRAPNECNKSKAPAVTIDGKQGL